MPEVAFIKSLFKKKFKEIVNNIREEDHELNPLRNNKFELTSATLRELRRLKNV